MCNCITLFYGYSLMMMLAPLIMKYMSVKENVTGSGIATNMQVHHGGAGTTATGLKAGVMYFSK